jgi:hypothetical protein
MMAIVQDSYESTDVLELRIIDRPRCKSHRRPSYFDLRNSGVVVPVWLVCARDDGLDPLG